MQMKMYERYVCALSLYSCTKYEETARKKRTQLAFCRKYKVLCSILEYEILWFLLFSGRIFFFFFAFLLLLHFWEGLNCFEQG